MAEEIEVTIFPQLEERLVELSNKLEVIAAEHAPTAWNLALNSVQVEYAQKAMWGAFLLCLFILIEVYARWMWKNADKSDDANWHRGAAVFICIFIGGLSFGAALDRLGPWTWVGLLKPEVVIAYRVLHGAI